MLVVVCVSIVLGTLIFFWSQPTMYVSLPKDINTAELKTLVELLESSKITYTVAFNDNRIFAEKSQYNNARILMIKANIKRKTVGYEILDNVPIWEQ
jgi:flagellar biosynthesis/type III secretory pathway M-ring protein FliF/YscJ